MRMRIVKERLSGQPHHVSALASGRCFMNTIYRADTIGSLLRPAYLKEARKAWQAGQISHPEFKRIEDRAVDAAIALQEGVGFETITDGEMRRLIFTGTLTEAIDGLSADSDPRLALAWTESRRRRWTSA